MTGVTATPCSVRGKFVLNFNKVRITLAGEINCGVANPYLHLGGGYSNISKGRGFFSSQTNRV
ncbi:hypothetical protein AhSzw1_119 [Aeromonas phage AhSzw-1]|uniref:Uncharacterized protein n=1 Tax=Aeromonas phage AhSzw-1 TaxID=2138299 RepID=A0A2R4AM97_9CAUD|nr:hypothetical protein HOT04_gp119 [Aeromonas phage AhSzw-1]AVR76155.1 hypothetical protein AhSzw1_119 [Aeromonas phage AhSzw-1]